MSSYTDMVLITKEETTVCRLNEAIMALGEHPFSGEYAHTLKSCNAPIGWIVDLISATEWDDPYAVQLFKKHENDEPAKFTEVKIAPLSIPGYVLFKQGDKFTFEQEREPLPSIAQQAVDAFGRADRLTVRAIAAGRLGRLDEFINGLYLDDRQQLMETITADKT